MDQPLYRQDPTGRFRDRAADYAAARPSYPAAALDALLEGLGAPAALVVADVGAGTGIAARLVAERGARVLAVEPNAAMRAAAEPHPRVLMGYSFGKAQRILAGVDSSIGPIFVHGAVEPLNRAYRAAGVALPETRLVSEVSDKAGFKRALVIAPPSVQNSAWTQRLGDFSDAFASGWMQLRGARRRRAVDRGFVLSDHADWPGLQRAIAATGAQRVIVTHGYESVMVRWLAEQGLEAGSFNTEYGDEQEAGEEARETAFAETPTAAP